MITIDDVLECITIEISMQKRKNVIVSCLYRTSGSKIEIFKDSMESMTAKTNHKSAGYVYLRWFQYRPVKPK